MNRRYLAETMATDQDYWDARYIERKFSDFHHVGRMSQQHVIMERKSIPGDVVFMRLPAEKTFRGTRGTLVSLTKSNGTNHG